MGEVTQCVKNGEEGRSPAASGGPLHGRGVREVPAAIRIAGYAIGGNGNGNGQDKWFNNQ